MKKIVLFFTLLMAISISLNAKTSGPQKIKANKTQICTVGEVTDQNGNVIGYWIKCPSGPYRIVYY